MFISLEHASYVCTIHYNHYYYGNTCYWYLLKDYGMYASQPAVKYYEKPLSLLSFMHM